MVTLQRSVAPLLLLFCVGCASSPEPAADTAASTLPKEAYVRALRPDGDDRFLLDTHLGFYTVLVRGACKPQLRTGNPITLDPAVGGLVPGQTITLNDLPCEVVRVERAPAGN